MVYQVVVIYLKVDVPARGERSRSPFSQTMSTADRRQSKSPSKVYNASPFASRTTVHKGSVRPSAPDDENSFELNYSPVPCFGGGGGGGNRRNSMTQTLMQTQLVSKN
jgi:hypothetical protein